ncbi:GFA family protein [Altererythrobacter litoralis]|uniref:GFA family protein n=1 Tax=Altererythrobacter litoralis TaxID=3113904 RepID=A0ABU7GD60_9SPHN|nr:GFA family protein [Erythrobacteraceae bacterium 1XM1-14]
MGLTGGCLCGQVRYELTADPLMCLTCHCKNCQRQAGSAYSIIVGVPEGALKVEGEVKTFNDKGDSGGTVQRQFCPDCGSPLFSLVEASPGLVWVKAGTLDDTSAIKPSLHVYTKSKQDWVELGDIPGVETVPSNL